jgi:hypothetical protein
LGCIVLFEVVYFKYVHARGLFGKGKETVI